MQLKILLEQTGRSWTLKPNREYVIGCDSSCDIAIPPTDKVANKHLKIGFDATANCWYMEDLGSPAGTFVNHQPVTRAAIRSQVRIEMGGGAVIVATPEGAAAPPPSPPMYAPSPTASNGSGYAAHSLDNALANQNFRARANTPTQQGPLQVLTWSQYFEHHLQQYQNTIQRFSAWFHLVTGFRHTPWIKDFGNIGFNSFEGYIIPNFQGSVDKVVIAVEHKVGELRQYENTKCLAAQLTDAHIVDSHTQTFTGARFSAIRRRINSHNGDFRRFCVTEYHRISNYLLVEKYGTDLFISWITRFEPKPSSAMMTAFLLIALAFSSIIFGFSGGSFTYFPLITWCQVYILSPNIIQRAKILPKKANSLTIMFLSQILIMLLLIPLASSSVSPGTNIVGALVMCFGILGLIFILLFFLSRTKSSPDIPPLDLVDAKKLDDMVSKQVEEALRPILQANGYSEDQMKEILTRPSAGGHTFRR